MASPIDSFFASLGFNTSPFSGQMLHGGTTTFDQWYTGGGPDELARQLGVPPEVVRAHIDSLSPEQRNALFAEMGSVSDPTPQSLSQYLASTGLKQQILDRSQAHGAQQQAAAQRNDITQQLQNFVNLLQTPVQNPDGTYSDPVARQLAQAGASQAGMEARNRGLTGGISVAAGQAGTMGALAPYLQQRQGMLQQGLGMLSNRNISLEQLQQQWDRLGMDRNRMQNELAMQQWQAEAAKRQAGAGLVGGVLGGAIGAGFGVPGLGAQIGSNVFGGLGAQSAGAPNLLAPPPPRSYGSGGVY